MKFRADSVEYWSSEGCETVFIGHAERELALVISGMPETGGHQVEWNDQGNAFSNGVKRAQLAGAKLVVELSSAAAARLGPAEFDITLVCDGGLLAEVSQRLALILGKKFAVKPAGGKAGAAASVRKPSAPPKDYSKIRYLNLEAKALRELPSYVSEMTALETAKLGRNPKLDFDAVCETLARCPALKELHFSTEQPVPESIGRLASLESLTLTGFTSPQTLPESMGLLRKLKDFLFMTDSAVTLPESFADLVDLERLNVRSKGWRIPSRFHRLRKLKTLDFGQCLLERVPEEMAEMTAVENVYFDAHCRRDYSQILPIVARMPNLVKLELNASPAPKEIRLCRQIKELSLWTGRRVETPLRLPDELGELTQLETLILSASRIPEIPDAIGNLTNLQSLVFIDSHFERLPDSIERLSDLKYLNVSGNPLFRELPLGGGLARLEQLYLKDNPALTRLPVSLRNLVSLREVRLSHPERVENVPESWSGLFA